MTTPMPLVQNARSQAPSYKPNPVARVVMRCVLMLALFLAIRLTLHAQHAVFADTPDDLLRVIAALHPEMPVQTSLDIAVIETNAPSYLASSDKARRYDLLSLLIEIEAEQLKPNPDLRRFWYEFIQVKAPELTEAEMDAIVRDWWSANGYRAVKHDATQGLRSATFKEVRAHLQIFRTGNDAQVAAAKDWLMMAQMAGGWESFRIPPQMQSLSPLAHLLARDISEEVRMYTGAEAAKLRRTVRSLLADKFMVEGDAGIAHIVSSSDVDAVLDGLPSEDEARKSSAAALLEEWLKRAIDADLKRYANASDSHR